jgi:hypothetical protein
MMRANASSMLGLVLVGSIGCGGGRGGGPVVHEPGSSVTAATPDTLRTEVQKIAQACAAPAGEADDYRTAKALATRLVGRWASCDTSGGKLGGYEYRTDGTWSRLEYRDDKGWVPLPPPPADRDDNGGMYKFFTLSGHASVAPSDDKTEADHFFVQQYIVRPGSLWGFEKSPRRAFTISYGHFARWVPIEP